MAAPACPPALRRLIGPAPVALAAATVAVAVPLRITGGSALTGAGPLVLLVAVVIGLPHGALDAMLITPGGWRRPGALLAGTAGYFAAAATVFLAWRAWPTLGVLVLLTVSAVHFAAADTSVLRWCNPAAAARPALLRAAATGALAVAGPFAWWPTQTGAVLGRLGAHHSSDLITHAARVTVIVAVLAVLIAVVDDLRTSEMGSTWRRAGKAFAEPAVVFALTAVCPPLVAFGVYFAGWHALRQTGRLLVLHPDAARRLRAGGIRPAVRTLALQAAVPSVVAFAGLTALLALGPDSSATALAALLAVSVPHAAVTAWREHALAYDAALHRFSQAPVRDVPAAASSVGPRRGDRRAAGVSR